MSENKKVESTDDISSLSKEEIISLLQKKSEQIEELEKQLRKRDEEASSRGMHQEATRREKCLVMRLTTKESESHDYLNQLEELRCSLAGGYRHTLLDPAVNIVFEKMRHELATNKEKLEQCQQELNAWKFTADSTTGKRLMAKCRMLFTENSELGQMVSSGRVATLEGDVALSKNICDELKKAQSESDSFLLELDEDMEGLQSAIVYLQQQVAGKASGAGPSTAAAAMDKWNVGLVSNHDGTPSEPSNSKLGRTTAPGTVGGLKVDAVTPPLPEQPLPLEPNPQAEALAPPGAPLINQRTSALEISVGATTLQTSNNDIARTALRVEPVPVTNSASLAAGRGNVGGPELIAVSPANSTPPVDGVPFSDPSTIGANQMPSKLSSVLTMPNNNPRTAASGTLLNMGHVMSSNDRNRRTPTPPAPGDSDETTSVPNFATGNAPATNGPVPESLTRSEGMVGAVDPPDFPLVSDRGVVDPNGSATPNSHAFTMISSMADPAHWGANSQNPLVPGMSRTLEISDPSATNAASGSARPLAANWAAGVQPLASNLSPAFSEQHPAVPVSDYNISGDKQLPTLNHHLNNPMDLSSLGGAQRTAGDPEPPTHSGSASIIRTSEMGGGSSCTASNSAGGQSLHSFSGSTIMSRMDTEAVAADPAPQEPQQKRRRTQQPLLAASRDESAGGVAHVLTDPYNNKFRSTEAMRHQAMALPPAAALRTSSNPGSLLNVGRPRPGVVFPGDQVNNTMHPHHVNGNGGAAESNDHGVGHPAVAADLTPQAAGHMANGPSQLQNVYDMSGLQMEQD